VDFGLTEEQRILRDTAARFIAENYGIARRQEALVLPEGFSRTLWTTFAELGLVAALLPEEACGLGGEGENILLVMEEIGRGLVAEPFLATAVLGAGVIAMCGSAAQKAHLEDVIGGTHLLAFAHGEAEGHYSLSEVRTRAERSGGGWVLNGQKAVVLNGDSADSLIVSARCSGEPYDEDGLALFLVDAECQGVSRQGYATIDGGRAADIGFSDVKLSTVSLLGEAGNAFPAIEQTIGQGVLALCGEALGIMEVCRDMTLDYLRTRKQFGVPIGKFQALQHRMVDLCLEIEQARSLSMLAASKLNAPRAERERSLSAAKNLVGRVGQLVAEESIQMHGGIAMTWEYALPHFAKRLIMIDHQLGDTDHHLERFIAFSQLS